MRVRFLVTGAAALLALAGCGHSSDATGVGAVSTGGAAVNLGGAVSTGGAVSPGGGVNGSGGSPAGGGTSRSGGNAATGGFVATGGNPPNAGGIANTGGRASSSGQGGTGAVATGGASASVGGARSGGASSSGTSTGPAYQGPCDLLTGGCAEAYSVTRAMTASYKGPLFQLGLTSDKTKTLDIGQTSAHAADMTTWSAFCGGSQSNCVVSKIYGQIHAGSNDMLPAVWNAPWGPNCSAGGYTCAAKFTVESATSLPILTTVAPQEYALSGDNFATGINGGNKAIGLMYNGKPVASQDYCCGVFGLAHKYNATDTYGTDFMVALAYGWRDSGGCCIAVNCGASNKYCVGAEEEENNDLYDYGTSPVENAMVVTQFDPTPNAVIVYLNGTQVLSHSPPAPMSRGNYPINAGLAIHLGGGGDLSQPDPVLMREALVTNTIMTASNVTAMKANIVAFYPSLKFP